MEHNLILIMLQINGVIYLIIQRPSHVFEVSVVQEHVGILLHPGSDLSHTDGANLRLRVPTKVTISINTQLVMGYLKSEHF